MPTYQYACTECGERLEKVQKFSDDPLTVCPACSGRLRKVFSPVGIVFKGSGFYRTDSRNGNGVIAGAKDKAESNGSGSGSSSDSGSGSGSGSGDKKGDSSGSSASGSSSSSSGASSPGSSSSGSSGEKVA
ncbi:MAG TPA: FmdB family zinc ribbon protein [Streptosporangiaceae bacterium]